MAKAKGHVKHVLLLRMDDGTHTVCDEYYPTDCGRVHMLGDSYYAEFCPRSNTLEYAKVSIGVACVVYEGSDWPEALAGCRDAATIIAHFS